jgi:hypothetical protein
VYIAPRHEKAGTRQFEARQLQAFLPPYRSVHRWKNGCRLTSINLLFPNYVFVFEWLAYLRASAADP